MFNLKEFLAMSEDEQITWLAGEGIVKLHGEVGRMLPVESFADLAFRLRDEAKKKDNYAWLRACYTLIKGKLDSYARVMDGKEAEYEVLKKGPKFWIAAALQAKEQSDGN